MTWAEFAQRVECELLEKGLTRDAEVGAIHWDRAAFGGPIPDLYVTLNADETFDITED